jgi:integrase/recombinase XerD
MSTRSPAGAGGPLAVHTEAVRAVLVGSGYAPGTVAAHLLLLRLLDAACAREHVGLDGLTDAGIEGLLVGVAAAGRPVTLRRLAPVLTGLRAAGVIPASPPAPPDAAGRLVEAYLEFLLGQRRLAESTAQHRGELATRFLRATATTHGPGWDIGKLQVGDLHAFLFDYASRSSVAGTRLVAETLRCFCRFLFATGRTGTDLSGTVPAPAGYRQHQLPKGIEAATARALLDSCDPGSVVGLRDIAVMTLMLRLGLRANEIACLSLEDLHWRTGDIEITGKGGRRDRLPLPADVGAVLVTYLQARPVGVSRRVFLRAVAPAGPLSRNGVVMIPRDASKRAGLAAVGAHRLRHTAATSMLAGGASLREVGQVLRHHGEQVTSVYARLDVAALAPVMRPWPGAGR